MFDGLTNKLDSIFKKLRGQGRITEQNVADALREVRLALLEADVNYKVVKSFIEAVQKKSVGSDVLQSITPGQQIIKIIHDEIVSLLGEARTDVHESQVPPTIILIAGLQGSGKTTFSAKLANLLRSKGRNPLLVAADIYRPAAIDQLRTLGQLLGIPVYSEESRDAVKIAAASIDFARKNIRDTVIIDTAGRLHVDENMMAEVEAIKNRVQPHETLFVVDSMTGQDAVNSAKVFQERLDFDGIVLTKLDGDTRGGAALSIRAIVQKPIKFASIGEKLDALEAFYPDRMASRILGMGDVVTLVEKVQAQFDQERSEQLQQKLRKAQFTFDDFLEQMRELKKMGSMDQILSYLPGMHRLPEDTSIDEGMMKRIEAIILSMTHAERMRPSIIDGNRRKRIAKGSGTTVQDVNRLLRQFDEMQKMMKRMSKGKMRHALRGMKFPTQ